MLPQCPALSVVYLGGNDIGDAGVGRLAGVLPQCPALFRLSLGGNPLGDEGGLQVLPQCPALSELHLNGCYFDLLGILAEVLPQCPALSHLDLSDNWIGDAGAQSMAGVR
jgi:Ran GTPase-activating protein (RanGAP) involved in mRNA processing and transport